MYIVVAPVIVREYY